MSVPIDAAGAFYVDAAGLVQPVPVDVGGNPICPDGSLINPAELAARAALVPPFLLAAATVAPGAGNAALINGANPYPTTVAPCPFAAGAVLGVLVAPIPPFDPVVAAVPTVVCVIPGAPPPPPGPALIAVAPNVQGLGDLAIWPNCVIPSQLIPVRVSQYKRYSAEGGFNRRTLERVADELRDLVNQFVIDNGGPPAYVANNAEMVVFIGNILAYLASASTSRKADQGDTVYCLANGNEFDIPFVHINGRVESLPRKWARPYTRYAYNLFTYEDIQSQWALSNGCFNRYLADFFEPSLLPTALRVEYAAVTRRVLARGDRQLHSNDDPTVHDTFDQTVGLNPVLQNAFGRAGIGYGPAN